MADNEHIMEKGAALRDFFASVDANDLQAAGLALTQRFNLSLDGEIDWTEVEYDFNRLFVGPAAVPAPPYASAYQVEPTLMGKPALEARKVYRRLGLAVPDQGQTPDDHLAFELDAAIALIGLDASGDDDLAGTRAWFIADHMGKWVPDFIAAIKAEQDVTPAVAVAADALGRWLESAVSHDRH